MGQSADNIPISKVMAYAGLFDLGAREQNLAQKQLPSAEFVGNLTLAFTVTLY